jgi:hypothetical protein
MPQNHFSFWYSATCLVVVAGYLLLLATTPADASLVGPNVSTGLPLAENITIIDETMVSIPMEIQPPPRDPALPRLGGQEVAGAIEAAFKSGGGLFTPIGKFFQRIVDSLFGMDQAAPAL